MQDQTKGEQVTDRLSNGNGKDMHEGERKGRGQSDGQTWKCNAEDTYEGESQWSE